MVPNYYRELTLATEPESGSETYDSLRPTKIGVLSELYIVVSSTESESEESEPFLPIPITTPLLMTQ